MKIYQTYRMILQCFRKEDTIKYNKLDDLGIKEQNWVSHEDIQHDMLLKQDGVFTFTIRVVNTIISDYVQYDTIRGGKKIT